MKKQVNNRDTNPQPIKTKCINNVELFLSFSMTSVYKKIKADPTIDPLQTKQPVIKASPNGKNYSHPYSDVIGIKDIAPKPYKKAEAYNKNDFSVYIDPINSPNATVDIPAHIRKINLYLWVLLASMPNIIDDVIPDTIIKAPQTA